MFRRSRFSDFAIAWGDKEFFAIGRGGVTPRREHVYLIDVFLLGHWFSFTLALGLTGFHTKYHQAANGDIVSDT